jgi:hypothetical protein
LRTARLTFETEDELAWLFAEQWEEGYQFRSARDQARQVGKLAEPAGAE